MAMERQDYPAMLPQLQPGQAVEILNDRVRHVGRLNTAIADWLQERRRLEEQYSGGLRRLARRQLEGVDLGIFSVPWDILTGSANTLADSHSALASRIDTDVERPLRDFTSTNRESQAMMTIQGNLLSIAKDVERAQQKTDKLEGRGTKAEAGRVVTANSELDHAQSQWDSQAPYVFESLQSLDEIRLNHLRDVLTQFQTHEIDQVEKSRTTAEHCLNVLLSVETTDEIKTFALKAISGKPKPERPQRSSTAGLPSPPRAAPSSSLLTPSISQPDSASQRSSSVQEDKKGRLKGLKRLGTVMGRKRESKLPPTLAPMAESPERKPRSSPFTSLGGRFGRSKEAQALEPTQESTERDRPYAPLRLGSEMLEAPSRTRAEPASPSPAPRSFGAPQVNGIGPAASPTPPLSTSIPNGSHQGDLTDLEPPQPVQATRREAEPGRAAAEPIKDTEGFTVPPQKLDPISQAQQEAAAANEGTASAINVNIRNAPIQDDDGDSNAALASVATSLQAPPPSRRVGTVRGRRDGRNSYVAPPEQTISSASMTAPTTSHAPAAASAPAPASEQIPEDQSEDMMPPTASAPAVQPPRTNAAGVLVQSSSGTFPQGSSMIPGFSPFASTASQASPFQPESRTATSPDPAGTDNQSIRSGRSLTSTGSQGMKHPDLNETGLNSSIVETVSARFENGKILSSSLIGEIALAYNPADFSSPFGTETIRLENFSSLEKVAPNPAFINQVVGREGEYSVNLSNIAKTQVAFKYQLRVEDTSFQAPMLLAPVFKIEPAQASVIINYSLNPDFNLHGRNSITLTNVMIGLTLEGAKVTGCQSKPVGTFARERHLIFWQIGEMVLRAGAAPEKLLARFATESEAKAGSAEARWEITGEHVQGLGSGLAVSAQVHQSGAAEGSDPFADEEGTSGLTAIWKGVQGVRKLASGVYTAI